MIDKTKKQPERSADQPHENLIGKALNGLKSQGKKLEGVVAEGLTINKDLESMVSRSFAGLVKNPEAFRSTMQAALAYKPPEDGKIPELGEDDYLVASIHYLLAARLQKPQEREFFEKWVGNKEEFAIFAKNMKEWLSQGKIPKEVKKNDKGELVIVLTSITSADTDQHEIVIPADDELYPLASAAWEVEQTREKEAPESPEKKREAAADKSATALVQNYSPLNPNQLPRIKPREDSPEGLEAMLREQIAKAGAAAGPLDAFVHAAMALAMKWEIYGDVLGNLIPRVATDPDLEDEKLSEEATLQALDQSPVDTNAIEERVREEIARMEREKFAKDRISQIAQVHYACATIGIPLVDSVDVLFAQLLHGENPVTGENSHIVGQGTTGLQKLKGGVPAKTLVVMTVDAMEGKRLVMVSNGKLGTTGKPTICSYYDPETKATKEYDLAVVDKGLQGALIPKLAEKSEPEAVS